MLSEPMKKVLKILNFSYRLSFFFATFKHQCYLLSIFIVISQFLLHKHKVMSQPYESFQLVQTWVI